MLVNCNFKQVVNFKTDLLVRHVCFLMWPNHENSIKRPIDECNVKGK